MNATHLVFQELKPSLERLLKLQPYCCCSKFSYVHISQVPADLSSCLMAELDLLVAQCDSAYRHAPTADTTVYTGTAGIALLHLHLATTLYADNSRKSRAHLEQAQSLLTPCLSRLPSRHVTFLCGAGGPLSIAAVLEAALGKPDKAKVRSLPQSLYTQSLSAACSQGYIQQLEQLYSGDKSAFSQLPSELLFGHVGYLYCLLFINTYLPGAISSELVQEVCHSELSEGGGN